MEDFTNANYLLAGYARAKRASGWKDSTQRYGLNLLRETRQLQRELREGTYQQGEGITFRLCEMGRVRLVRALSTRDLIMQHALCDVVLVPRLKRKLIHDNGASLKGKGISFTRRRFEQHLRWHFRRYGREGYALKIDFRKYFDNIRHDVFWAAALPYLETEAERRTLKAILKANEVDISFTEEPDYIERVHNALEYEQIDPRCLTGRRFMAKGMGIGAPAAQIAGIFLPTPIDTWAKTVKGIHCYDAYMDDRIILHPEKAYLKELLAEIRQIAGKLGIHINERKTQIIKLSKGVTFLKTRYRLTETGKIIRGIPKDTVTRQRRKMKKLAAFVRKGDMRPEAFDDQYRAWRGDKRRYCAKRTIEKLDRLHRRLRTWTKTKETTSCSRSSRKSST